jgi:hypothetical protein
MKRVFVAVLLTLVLAYGAATEENGIRVVLPNPKLLRCNPSDCDQVWLKNSTNRRCVPEASQHRHESKLPHGMTAIYDKSVPFDDIRTAIDERYGKWAVPQLSSSPLKMRRVVPEKFAIQLSVVSKKEANGISPRREASDIHSVWRKDRVRSSLKLVSAR